jgi:DnaJ-class molecular chaperone
MEMKLHIQGRSICPRCMGRKLQSNRSIHGLPAGSGNCCICNGAGTVCVDYYLFLIRSVIRE